MIKTRAPVPQTTRCGAPSLSAACQLIPAESGQLDKKMKTAADYDGRRQDLYIVGQRRGDDDCEVVRHGRQCRRQEMPACIEDAHEHPADGKEYR